MRPKEMFVRQSKSHVTQNEKMFTIGFPLTFLNLFRTVLNSPAGNKRYSGSFELPVPIILLTVLTLNSFLPLFKAT
jgi:hypothetical protein